MLGFAAMGILWPRLLKFKRRKDSLVSFLVIMGLVDMAIGGIGGYGSLLLLGLSIVSGAIALRWRHPHPPEDIQPERIPQRYLPTKSSRSQLPLLSIPKKRPPD